MTRQNDASSTAPRTGYGMTTLLRACLFSLVVPVMLAAGDRADPSPDDAAASAPDAGPSDSGSDDAPWDAGFEISLDAPSSTDATAIFVAARDAFIEQTCVCFFISSGHASEAGCLDAETVFEARSENEHYADVWLTANDRMLALDVARDGATECTTRFDFSGSTCFVNWFWTQLVVFELGAHEPEELAHVDYASGGQPSRGHRARFGDVRRGAGPIGARTGLIIE